MPTPSNRQDLGAGRPAVFFDRDGIVNRSPGPGYVERWEDFHLLPAFLRALRLVRAGGYAAVVVTNQRGVGRGLMSRADLDAIHARLARVLEGEGLHLDAIYACTVDDDAHPDRKPNPGMLLRAARDLGLDLQRSWMIGDSERDILAGRAAGCRTIRVAPETEPSESDLRVADMEALPPMLARVLERPAGTTETRV